MKLLGRRAGFCQAPIPEYMTGERSAGAAEATAPALAQAVSATATAATAMIFLICPLPGGTARSAIKEIVNPLRSHGRHQWLVRSIKQAGSDARLVRPPVRARIPCCRRSTGLDR